MIRILILAWRRCVEAASVDGKVRIRETKSFFARDAKDRQFGFVREHSLCCVSHVATEDLDSIGFGTGTDSRKMSDARWIGCDTRIWNEKEGNQN